MWVPVQSSNLADLPQLVHQDPQVQAVLPLNAELPSATLAFERQTSIHVHCTSTPSLRALSIFSYANINAQRQRPWCPARACQVVLRQVSLSHQSLHGRPCHHFTCSGTLCSCPAKRTSD